MADSIQNPSGAHQTISTFVSGVADDGTEIEYGSTVRSYRANAAVVRGDALSWVVPTATVPLSVKPMATTDDPRSFAGVAQEGKAAGGYVRVVTEGHALLRAAAGSPAANDVVTVPAVTAGLAVWSATDPDATTIAGTQIGYALGIKNATSLLAPVIVKHM